jgi:MoxR-like ATPase
MPPHGHQTGVPTRQHSGSVAVGERSDRARWFEDEFTKISQNVETFIRGKSSVVRLSLVCMMGEGHLLIDDIPGVGKTSLAKAMANSISGSMNRIQFTPDLLPSDVIGVPVWNQRTSDFEFRPGPVFTNLLVGDEINRASPKTQSALLEVMEERHVTVDGITHDVPRPFVVIATQNPIEFDGTYRLPEAQIDRFMMRMAMGYPEHAAEVEVLRNRTAGRDVDEVKPVCDIRTVQTMMSLVHEIFVAPSLYNYVVTICASTRKVSELRLGVSPRGSLALLTASQAWAAAAGREFVTPDDIKILAPHVLSHRMLLTSEAEMAGETAESILRRIISAVPVPDDRVRE